MNQPSVTRYPLSGPNWHIRLKLVISTLKLQARSAIDEYKYCCNNERWRFLSNFLLHFFLKKCIPQCVFLLIIVHHSSFNICSLDIFSRRSSLLGKIRKAVHA